MSELLQPHLRDLRAAGYSENTIHARRWRLSTLDEALPEGIDRALPDELAEYLDQPDWAPWTRVTYYRHICGFYRWAAGGRDPYLNYDPSADLIKPKPPQAVPHPVEDDEVANVLGRVNERWRLIISLASFAGLRAAEITRQLREDISEKSIRIVQGKGRKDAYIPTHPEIWKLVRDRPTGPLIVTRKGTTISSGNLTSMARVMFDSMDMYEIHLHRFRHWYAYSLLVNGTDIRTVQGLMRHASLQTTAGYLPLVDEQRRLAISTLPVPSSPLKSAA